ncbi:hypothetical protein LAZ40_07035 [Cereibacter sphaeroides]|uniref:hypothetical protein n=1 Tax=Cereibacter sphaeroides TaxID=1063 RepID=UPI001F3E3370|nr:hypothetical protein [Cereibacter sphaeroides]MCE6958802.1 hypothetical protein [Cereibacter sphaeroides]MCE6973324.1 hypothetical protein [Cereibacter sphaeroides]
MRRWRALLAEALAEAPLVDDHLHGEIHWRGVAEAGLRIADWSPGVDRAFVLAFAILHDCRRMDDGWDPDHGLRAAGLVRTSRVLRTILPESILPKLAEACLRHESGHRCSEDRTIGASWDADRLNLVRLGRPLDPDRFSLLDVRDLDLLGPAMATVVRRPPSWEELCCRADPHVSSVTADRPRRWRWPS